MAESIVSVTTQTLAFPVPVSSPLLSGSQLTIPWTKFFRSLGDATTRSATPQYKTPNQGDTNYIGKVESLPDTATLGQTAVMTDKTYLYNGVKWISGPAYLLAGAICHIFYDLERALDTEMLLRLPFESALPFKYEGVEYLAGTKTVNIASGTRVIQLIYAIVN